MEPLEIRQGRAGAVQKISEVWWEGRHHKIPEPPISPSIKPSSGCHVPAIWLGREWPTSSGSDAPEDSVDVVVSKVAKEGVALAIWLVEKLKAGEMQVKIATKADIRLSRNCRG
jgi:hypothetical protein